MGEDAQQPGADEPRRPALRVSDRDREVVAEALREAYAEGRLTFAEHDERLGRVWSARTAADLEPLVEDLPVGGGVVPRGDAAAAPRRGRQAARSGPGFAGHGLALHGGDGLAVLSSSTVSPPVGTTSATGVSVLGSLVVDLRECLGAEDARGRTFRLTVNALLGSVEVLVPEGVEVRMGGAAVLGTRQLHGTSRAGAGAPALALDGVALLGSVDVRRRS